MSSKYSKTPIKRKSISLDTKIKILNRIEKGEGPSSIARSYGINESTVRTIKKMKDIIRRSVSSGSKYSSYTRHSAIENMEKALMKWIDDNTQKDIPISSCVIRQKAVNIYNHFKNQSTSSDQQEHNFSGSKGWFENFKKRYSLHNLKFKDETASVDEMAAKEFPLKIAKIIEENAYSPDQVFNAHETVLFWKRMPNIAHVSKTVKTSSDRVTFLLCSNASGDHIMKPLLINRALKPRAMKGMNISDLPVHWMVHKKTWVTTDVFRDWFYKYFIVEVENYLKKKKLAFKVLLLLDNAPGHLQNLEHPNVRIVYLPSNTSSLIQPLDQGIIYTFKINYIKRTFQDIFNKLENDESLTILEGWKKLTILNCVKNATFALNDIRSSTLNACWKAIWPEVVVTGNAVPTPEEEIVPIINLLHSFEGEGFENINVDDIRELLVDYELTDNELIDMMPETHLENDTGSDSNEAVSFTAQNIYKALQLATKLENIILEIDPNVKRALKFHQDLSNCCSQYQEIYDNLTKNKLEKESSRKRKAGHDNEPDMEVQYISSDEDSNFEPFRKMGLIVLECDSDKE